MPINLPNIDIDKISSLDEAKQVLREVLNTFERFLQLYEKKQEEIKTLQEEIARLLKSRCAGYMR